MSTALKHSAPEGSLPDVDGMTVAIVSTLWNSDITDALLDGALDVFYRQHFDTSQVKAFRVPGAVELTFAASQLIECSAFDVIIVLGCVIRGGTPHFDYVCQSVTQGITSLNADCDTPVIFGVLTVDTKEDALDRAGGRYGNKGAEAAETAIRMHAFAEEVKNL